MSTDTSDADDPSLLTRLSDNFLRCPMCRQRYRQPRLLTCLHALCQTCLEALRDAALTRQRFKLSFVSVECPCCHRLTDVTPGVDRLPADSVRARLLEVVALAEAASAAPAGCELCVRREQRVASTRCLDCGKLLCAACRQRHRRVRVTSDHELVDLGRQTAFSCDSHPSELVRFYCASCQLPVCVACTFSSAHSGHSVLNFKEAASARAAELAECSQLCSEKLHQLGSALRLARRLECQLSATETAIRDAAAQQMASIRASQKALLDELTTFYDCCSELVAGRHEIAAALRNLTEVSSFSELVQLGKHSESLLLAPRVATALSRYANYRPPEVPQRLHRYQLVFQPGQAALGCLQDQRLGSSSSVGGSTASVCSACSGSTGSVEISSLSADDASSAAIVQEALDESLHSTESTPERSFFTYDNSTLRSSVCRSITTDTLVGPLADAECQTDICVVVNLGFAVFSITCPQGAEVVPEVATADEEDDSGWRLLNIAVSHQDTAASLAICNFSDAAVDLAAAPLCKVQDRTPLCAGLCSDVCVTSELCPLAPTLRGNGNDCGSGGTLPEVRVCSVMFSSLESNEFEPLEAAQPTLLRDVGTQAQHARWWPAVAAGDTVCSTAGTQTPHLPLRRELVATGVQTAPLTAFTRDCQAEPDTAERWTQTRRLEVQQQHRGSRSLRADKATQWAPPQRHQQVLYRSGRAVAVVGATTTVPAVPAVTAAVDSVCERLALSPRSHRRHDAPASSASCSSSAQATEPQLHRLTECLTQPPKTGAAPLAGVRTAGVRFPKPAAKPEEGSLSRLKSFCTRLRQRRSGLAKQKIVVLND